MGIISLTFTIMQSLSRASEYILTNAKDAYIERLSQTNKVFEDNLTHIGSITGFLGTTEDMVSWMKKYPSAVGSDRSTIQQDISSVCSKAMIFNKYIDGMAVVTQEETIYVATREFTKLKYSDIKKDLLSGKNYYEMSGKNSIKLFLPQNEDDSTGDMTILDYLKTKFFFYVPVKEGAKEYGGIFVILNQTILTTLLNLKNWKM